MSTDSRLQTLQRDLESYQRSQSSITEDIRDLRRTMEEKIKRIQSDYGNDISSLERKLDVNARKMSDTTRQIETRLIEIEKDRQRDAGSAGERRSSW